MAVTQRALISEGIPCFRATNDVVLKLAEHVELPIPEDHADGTRPARFQKRHQDCAGIVPGAPVQLEFLAKLCPVGGVSDHIHFPAILPSHGVPNGSVVRPRRWSAQRAFQWSIFLGRERSENNAPGTRGSGILARTSITRSFVS